MVEYIYDVIKMTSGENNEITAIITDDEEDPITEGVDFFLYDKDGQVMSIINGIFEEGYLWHFLIPAEITKGLKGRFWYSIKSVNGDLCFMKPFYLE